VSNEPVHIHACRITDGEPSSDVSNKVQYGFRKVAQILHSSNKCRRRNIYSTYLQVLQLQNFTKDMLFLFDHPCFA